MASLVQSIFHRGNKDHGISAPGKSRKGKAEEPMKWAGQASARPAATQRNDQAAPIIGRARQNPSQPKVPSPYTAAPVTTIPVYNGKVHFQSPDVTVVEEADKVRIIFASVNGQFKTATHLEEKLNLFARNSNRELYLLLSPGKPVQKEDPKGIINPIKSNLPANVTAQPVSYGPIPLLDLDDPHFGLSDHRTSSSEEAEGSPRSEMKVANRSWKQVIKEVSTEVKGDMPKGDEGAEFLIPHNPNLPVTIFYFSDDAVEKSVVNLLKTGIFYLDENYRLHLTGEPNRKIEQIVCNGT